MSHASGEGVQVFSLLAWQEHRFESGVLRKEPVAIHMRSVVSVLPAIIFCYLA